MSAIIKYKWPEDEKKPSRDMNESRKQGRLLKEVFAVEFDIMPQLKLSWVEIGLRLTKELQRILESENK